MGREVFNHLHEELSLLKGELFPRMELWNLVGQHFDPISLTKDQALAYLFVYSPDSLPEVPAKKIRRMVKRFERWDPEADTPEEIFERICGGKSQDT